MCPVVMKKVEVIGTHQVKTSKIVEMSISGLKSVQRIIKNWKDSEKP